MGRMLRPEASELEWEHLFPEQKEAYLELAELLAAAVDGKGGKGPERTNRIIFLDGVSGVGKTTVYLSLKRYLEEKNGEKKKKFGPPGKLDTTDATGSSNPASDKPNEAASPTPPESREYLNKINDQVIWLDPLELEILSQPTNALADLLVHIEDKMNPLMGESSRINISKQQEDCVRKLERIQNNLAALWDGNSPHRAARVQPEAFAAEVVDTARHRAKIRKELNDLIDGMAEHFFDNKLIVLPIDDLHEYPSVALDILRLLRIIHSRHFAIFAIGNFESLKIVEKQKNLREFKSFSAEQEQTSSGRGIHLQDELTKRATNLAHFSLTKQFAESQKISLHPLDPENSNTWRHIVNPRSYPHGSFSPSAYDNDFNDLYKKPLHEIFCHALEAIIQEDRNSTEGLGLPRHIKTALNSGTIESLIGHAYRPRLVFSQSVRHLLDFQTRLCLYLHDVRRKNKVAVPRFSLQELLRQAKATLGEEYYDGDEALSILDDIFLLNPYNYNRLQVNEKDYQIDAFPSSDCGEKGKELEVVTIEGVRRIPPQTAAWLHILLSLLAILGYYVPQGWDPQEEEKIGQGVNNAEGIPRFQISRRIPHDTPQPLSNFISIQGDWQLSIRNSSRKVGNEKKDEPVGSDTEDHR